MDHGQIRVIPVHIGGAGVPTTAIRDTPQVRQELIHWDCLAMDTPVSKSLLWRLYGQPVRWGFLCDREGGGTAMRAEPTGTSPPVYRPTRRQCRSWDADPNSTTLPDTTFLPISELAQRRTTITGE